MQKNWYFQNEKLSYKKPDWSKGSKWELTKKTGTFAEAVRTDYVFIETRDVLQFLVDLEESLNNQMDFEVLVFELMSHSIENDQSNLNKSYGSYIVLYVLH